ncbi:MAG: hypothetical protein NTY15_01860 [Planctomycetota bacterium]|jgi:hypothetical protein|nr:hypothetical protein [Planctomycetota bacterium]
MQNHEVDDSFKAFSSDLVEIGCVSPKNLRYDDGKKRLPSVDPAEGTVIWIAKDSESKPEQYLEECNTHQNGE